jgi:hypothetical protein
MVCGQIHAPATLPNYVHMHLMNSKFLTSLHSSKPRMFVFVLSNWRLSFPSEETCYAVPWVLWSHIPMRSLIHSAKRCFYRKCICDSIFRIGIFLLCTLLCPPPPRKELRHLVSYIWHGSYSAVKTETHFMCTIAGYITGKRDYTPTLHI